jgi:hypothetical protein
LRRFRLIRVLLQPSTTDLHLSASSSRDNRTMLTFDQKKQVLKRFFPLAGESSEETKVLSIQLLIFL